QVVGNFSGQQMAGRGDVQNGEVLVGQGPGGQPCGVDVDGGVRPQPFLVQNVVRMIGEPGDADLGGLIPGQAAGKADVQQLVLTGNLMGDVEGQACRQGAVGAQGIEGMNRIRPGLF